MPAKLCNKVRNIGGAMALSKTAIDRISKRGGVYYYVRRVPRHLAALDGRVIVRISLHTSDLGAARLAAIGAERELEILWASLAGEEGRDAWARYQAALERARLEGFSYRAAPEIVHGRLVDMLARIEALAGRPQDVPAASALLGLAPRPEVTLSSAFERYKALCRGENLGKREDQVRRWENARKLSIANFQAVLGDDKPLDQITRDDARKFHNWWVDRITSESLGRNAANKQIGQVSKILHVVGDEIGLQLGPLFAGLSFDERKQKRPPIAREFVEGVLLAPGALRLLNLEARAALLLCAETGMGTEEVTSLLPEHIHLSADVPYISITSREGAAQKTEYRPRDIPLVGVALLAAKACLEGVPRYAGRPASLSALINKFLRQHDLLPGEAHSLYSLHHAFQDRLTAVEAPDRLQADLMGHKYVRERYGVGPSLEQKAKWLEKIAYKVAEGFSV
jgi:integrase